METRPLTISLTREGILFIIIQGELTKERLPLLKEDIEKAKAFIREESQQALRPLPVLIDLTNLSSVYEPEAMLVLADFEKADRPYVQRTICFGASAKIKLAGEIISALSNRENISFFDTKEEAVASLKSD